MGMGQITECEKWYIHLHVFPSKTWSC